MAGMIRRYTEMNGTQQKEVQRWIRGDSGNGLEQLASSEYYQIKNRLQRGEIEEAERIFQEALYNLSASNENLGVWWSEYNSDKKTTALLFFDCFSSRIGRRSINKEL